MKIEKINDKQIRFTLNKKDLEDRHLNLSELAYGSDKANALFKDMLFRAHTEYNFEAEDIPIMIEAIPLSSECLVLVLTKVTDPDELDTRFSNFTPPRGGSASREAAHVEKNFADEIISCFEHISNILGQQLADKLLGEQPLDEKSFVHACDDDELNIKTTPNLCKVYSFNTLDEVIGLARTINRFYHGENTLYKNPADGKYYLVVCMSEHTAGEFNKVVNIISEYVSAEKRTSIAPAYFDEHCQVICRNKAIQVLAKC